ncbi:Uncharacterised protein [Mycobacterium tuberculosis]|nr:Uncharacterised protein [Mycobacterium tuberculosis]
MSDWNKVLTSSCTAEACTTASGRNDFGEGDWGGTNSTDLAPKTVLPPICTVALEGMNPIWPLLMAKVNRAWSPS